MAGIRSVLGDFWGGTAAMLVALPAAIAFGVSVYATIGGHYGAYGAVAGILGVAAVGIIASLLGGTERLISAPSAPAAAVLSAFASQFVLQGISADVVFGMLMMIALFAGVFQIAFGVIGLGRLIKYMPFPVVSGYLSGIGLYIIAAQTPKFLGAAQGSAFWETIRHPALWQWQSITVGMITVLAMVYATAVFRAVPAVIIALAVGTGSYFSLGIVDPSLLIPNNPFIVGELGGAGGIDFFESVSERFGAMAHLNWDSAAVLFFPALTLAALLSIDTLKTCVILDSMTHTFHDSNKELIAQGSGNIVSSLIGGMPGSGTMGATMINISSGAVSRFSGLIEGVMAVAAFVVLGAFIAWIPVSALGAVLMVIGLRMIDRHSIRLLKSHKTALDFVIIAVVAVTALSVSLIAAAGVGLVLAVVLYIAQQIDVSVVFRHTDGMDTRSKVARNREETAVLRQNGGLFSVYELHGSLFFGTANQLYAILEEDLKSKKYIILDMKRVQTVDLTAAHILLQIKDILQDKGGFLLLTRLPHKLPTGEDLEKYFNQVGLLKHLSPIKVFDDLDEAVEWAEDQIISDHAIEATKEPRLFKLEDFDLFKGRNLDTLEEIQSLVESRSYRKGETIFSQGDRKGEICLVRRGLVKVILPVAERKRVHLGTIGQGNFFGEFSFLEGAPQYTDAVAGSDIDLFVISRTAFDAFSEHHKKASFHFMQSLAAVLSERLRLTSTELGEEYDV